MFKKFLAYGLALGLGCSLLSNLSHAALPDPETVEFIRERYSLIIDTQRSGCSYYANPETLGVQGRNRSISVLLMRGPSGGTMCNGVFKFQVLSVQCNSNHVSYSDRIGSPANDEENWVHNPEVARTICSLTPRT